MIFRDMDLDKGNHITSTNNTGRFYTKLASLKKSSLVR